MIVDILFRVALLEKQIPESEFDADLAVETAIEDVDRPVTDDERDKLDEVLPEWLDQEVPA